MSEGGAWDPPTAAPGNVGEREALKDGLRSGERCIVPPSASVSFRTVAGGVVRKPSTCFSGVSILPGRRKGDSIPAPVKGGEASAWPPDGREPGPVNDDAICLGLPPERAFGEIAIAGVRVLWEALVFPGN